MDKKEYIEQLASKSFVLKNGYLNIIEEGGPASSLFYDEGECSAQDFHGWLSSILSAAYDHGAASKDIVSTECPDPMDSVEARAMKDRLWSIMMRGSDGPVTWDMVALEAGKMAAENVRLRHHASNARMADERALAVAREEGERKGWEDAMGNLSMAIAMDHGLIEIRRQEANRALIAVKEAEMKVTSGEAYYELLKFRAPEGVKIGYEDSDSSKKEGK